MFKVAILQKRSINEQIDKNIETIIMAMEEASENHADILLLPECFITGYDLPMSYEKSIAEHGRRDRKGAVQRHVGVPFKLADAEVVSKGEVRHFHPLGRVQRAGV